MAYLDNFNPEKIDSTPEVRQQLRLLKKAIDNGEIGGGGDVASVNGKTGVVVLDAEDVGAATAAQGAKADSAIQEIKTINGNSLVGSGNIVTTEETVVFDGTPTLGSTNGITSDGVAKSLYDLTDKQAVKIVKSPNLFDCDTMYKAGIYITPSNGNEASNNSYASSDFIPVKPSTNYTLSVAKATNTSSIYWNVIEYNSQKTRVDSHAGYGTFQTSENTAFIRFCFGSTRTYSSNYGDIASGQHKYYIQLEEGTEATIPMPFGDLIEIKDIVYNNFATSYNNDKKTTFACPNGVYGVLGYYLDFNQVPNDTAHTSSVYLYDEEDTEIVKCAVSANGILLPTVKSWSYGIITTTNITMVTITKGINKYPMQIGYYPFVSENNWTFSHNRRNKVVFFGDSFTSIDDYPKAVLSDVRPNDWYLFGQSGQPITNYTNRLDTLVQSITLSDYDTMFITGGSNDFNLAYSLAEVSTAMEAFFAAVFTEAPNIELIWFIPTYTYGYQSESSTGTDINKDGIHISEYANTIKSTCAKHGVKFYDAYCKSGINYWTVSTLTRDGLHPTENTFYRIGHEITKECL